MKLFNFFLCSFLLLSLHSCNEDNVEESSVESELLQLIENSNLKHNILIIDDINGSDISHSLIDNWEKLELLSQQKRINLSDGPGDELCRGSGLGFIKCVQKAVDGGKCVLVYKDGDDYVGEETSC